MARATKLWLIALERSLRAQFIPHIVFTFSSKNSRDISVFVQAYAPFMAEKQVLFAFHRPLITNGDTNCRIAKNALSLFSSLLSPNFLFFSIFFHFWIWTAILQQLSFKNETSYNNADCTIGEII